MPAAIKLEDRPKVFNGDWVDLKLAEIEILSHNTKRFRFEFDDPEAVSGLPVACKDTRFLGDKHDEAHTNTRVV